MEIPEAFRRMVQRMHVDIAPDVGSEEELYRSLAKGVANRGDREIVVGFIDRLLASDMNDRKLARIWDAAGSDGPVRRSLCVHSNAERSWLLMEHLSNPKTGFHPPVRCSGRLLEGLRDALAERLGE